MTTKGYRPSNLSAAEQQTADRLKQLLEATGLGYKIIGKLYNIGTAGAVSQYANGTRPLGLPAALKFAAGLNVPLEQISPELAAKIGPGAMAPAQVPALHQVNQTPAAYTSPITLANSLDYLAQRLQPLDTTARRRAAVLLADLAEEPEQHASLCPLLEAIFTSSKRAAA